MASTAALSPSVLADTLPIGRARSTVLVLAAVLLTAASAQLMVPLPFSPVPISGQTFAVLLAAAALGPGRAVLAQGLYLILAGAGFPFLAGAESGWHHFAGATGGYLAGFVVASAVVGALARRGLDRTVLGAVGAFLIGSAAIYALGLPWLAVVLDVSAAEALRLGFYPFLVGDALKVLLAAGLLPTVWRLAAKSRE